MPITPTSTKSKQYQALGIDEIANDIETAFTAINNLEGGGSGTTEIVNISSAQILAMGTTPIQLLPAAGVGKYYDIDKVILEYTHVTTAYTLGTATRIRVSDSNGMMFFDADSAQLSEVDNNVSRLTPITVFNNAAGAGGSEITQGYFYTNDSLSLSTISDAGSGVDVTLGDGTLRVIITYNLRTFGA